jgi:antirestriction protein ArdC
MSKTNSRRRSLTSEQRAERRQRDREFAERAVAALRTSAGWQAWLTTRGTFHRYSLSNSCLLAMQMPEATLVAGFRRWLALGYCVRKGEKALRIWQPVPPSKRQLAEWRAGGSLEAEKPRVRFTLGAVFDRSQVAPLDPPAQPAPLDPPIRPIGGDELAPAWPALVALAADIGSTVALSADRSCDGSYRPSSKAITVGAELSMNQRVLALCHELAHALVRADTRDEDPQLSYAAEEWVAECVAFVTCRALGVDTQANSVPYLAAYVEGAPEDTVGLTAALVDRLARRIEDAAMPALNGADEIHGGGDIGVSGGDTKSANSSHAA